MQLLLQLKTHSESVFTQVAHTVASQIEHTFESTNLPSTQESQFAYLSQVLHVDPQLKIQVVASPLHVAQVVWLQLRQT